MSWVVGRLAVVAVASASIAGCSADPADGVPVVATGDLQADIAQRLSEVGQIPQSVSCEAPLVGETGQTVRCDVVVNAGDSFQPVVTVTDVEGDDIDYELVPALSTSQLEREVAELIDTSGGPSPSSVRCEGGLTGRAGESAQCDVTAGGATLRRTAEVTDVEGLMMSFDLIPILTRTEVESSLLNDLSRHVAQRPDSVTCTGDLEGRPGNTVDCSVIAGPERAAFVVTVNSVDGANIDYSYAPRS